MDISELKHLQSKTKELATLVEYADDAIVGLDLNRRITVWNKGAERLYGYMAEEVINKPTSLFIPPDLEDEARLMREQAMQGQITRYETTRLCKDGSRIIVSLTLSAIRDTEGRIVGIASIAHDITQRRKMEEEQKRTQNLLAMSQRLAHIGSWETELSTGKTLWSNEMFQIFGLPMQTVFYLESVLPLLSSDEIVCFRQAVESAIRGDVPYSIDYRIKRPDGEYRIIHDEGEVVYDDQGTAIKMYGTTQDITERKQDEQALIESEEKFRNIMEQSADGIVVTNSEGTVVEWNKSQELLTGLKKSETLGKSLWEVQSILVPTDIKTPALLSKIQEEMEAFLHSERNPIVEKRERRLMLRDGSIKTVLEGAFLVRQSTQNMGVFILSDITDRKNAESERLKYEQYVQQSQRLESLGVLAGGIAHDFNNILTGIFGFTDLAKSQAKDEAVSEYLSQAMESMERAKALTQQLLTFSKGGTPVRKIVPISQLIKETGQFALHGSNIKGRYAIDENLWLCNVDRNQIAQVIQNLILNAVQAMPMGGIIEIAATNVKRRGIERPTLKEGNYVAISVKDQGTGISEEMLPKIFDPFFTTKIKGHGLGLAISHSIISRHEGAIDAQSELGKGTTFTIYLPACDESCVENAETASISHKGTGRILVMDDEEPVRKLVSKMLQSFGYSVVSKENGNDTLDFFIKETKNKNAFAAMILDLTIPGGMGGKEVAQEIRKLDKEIPLFVASGYAGDPIIAQPQEYGFTASISKPFKIIELMEMLEKHMRKGK
jgi:PAS domain S-box-containing protein